jgi:hypothetical protein
MVKIQHFTLSPHVKLHAPLPALKVHPSLQDPGNVNRISVAHTAGTGSVAPARTPFPGLLLVTATAFHVRLTPTIIHI